MGKKLSTTLCYTDTHLFFWLWNFFAFRNSIYHLLFHFIIFYIYIFYTYLFLKEISLV